MDQPRNIVVFSPNARIPKPDVVIWDPRNGKIMFTIRLHQKSNITLSTIYRWMTEARNRGLGYDSADFTQCLLYPAKVEALTRIMSFLRYKVIGHGDPLPRVSSALLNPGVYGAFLPGLRSCYLPLPIGTTRSMLNLVEYELACDWRKWTTASVKDFNKDRIQDQACMISGLPDDVISLSIVPPMGVLFPEACLPEFPLGELINT